MALFSQEQMNHTSTNFEDWIPHFTAKLQLCE